MSGNYEDSLVFYWQKKLVRKISCFHAPLAVFSHSLMKPCDWAFQLTYLHLVTSVVPLFQITPDIHSCFFVSVMNTLILLSSSDFDVSSPSPATRSPPRRRWLGTAGPSTTGRCRSPTSPSLLKDSSRSSPTRCSNTRLWWGRRCPTHTPPPWW